MGLNSFDKLLEPYKDGGTEKAPVDVTMGNICSKLMISYRIPPEIVGVAIYKVFKAMANDDLKFKGNGKYGSKGAELFSCIKAQCVDITEKKSVELVKNKIKEVAFCTQNDCRFRSREIEKNTWQSQVKRFFGMRSGWFSVLVTISPIIGLLTWLCIVG